jgi:hypothetical protein
MPAVPTHAPRLSEDARLQQRLDALGGPSAVIEPPTAEVAPMTEAQLDEQLAAIPPAPTRAIGQGEAAALHARLPNLSGTSAQGARRREPVALTKL